MATENIVVAVRMRPLIPREIEKDEIYWKAEPPKTICQINTSDKPAAYSFDHVFDGKVENGYIYNQICSGIVRSVIDGFNSTIFAYGQTSSGKTFTMLGDKERNIQGIMHYAIEDIFELIQNMTDREFLLRVSYMEIYNETVRDLSEKGKDNLKVHEENGQIKVNDLHEMVVQTPEQILNFMKACEYKRRTGNTRLNEKSSRSHAIFRMIIESCVRGVEDAAVNVSQFNLVDLAGSERARHTGATGTRFKESVKINQSLLTLGLVIRQLSENENHINYRDSKLTRILQNSLGGNSLTAIICTVTAACFDETQSTLKFAEQAKRIRNKPQVNEVLTEQALLKQYANKIKKLTAELEATKEEKSQQNRHLQEKIKNLEEQFVFQMNPLKARKNRRETWGGALDAARFCLPIAPQNSFKNRPSFSRSRVGSCNLSILEEQCEDADADEIFLPHQSIQQLKGSKRSSNSKRNSNLLLTADVAVQVEPVTLCLTPKLPESGCDKMKMMAEKILYLEKELAELREFTTLERQIMESCSSSLDVFKVKNTISASDDLPSHSGIFSANFNTSIFEEMEQKNLINEDSIFSPGDTSRINFNERKEILFQYLESTMKMMGMRKHIDFPSVANDLNNNYKITLEMFYLILQYQCLSFKGCFKSEICKKIDGVLCNLRDVFKSFTDQKTSDETVENLINNFINQTDYLLKEIEMVSLDSDIDDKNEIINQSRPFDSITELSSFEESPYISLNKNETDIKNRIDGVNMSSNMHENENIKENAVDSVCNCEKLKSAIIALEKDIKVYQNSILTADFNKEGLKNEIDALEKQIKIYQTAASDLDSENKKNKDKIACLEKDMDVHLKILSDCKYDSNLKDKQITILKDKIEIQKQMIDSFANELTLKDKQECKCSLEVVSSIVPNSNSNPLITFKEQACQATYMEGISLCSGLDESNVSERTTSNSSTNLCYNCDRFLNESKISVNEQHSEEVCQQTLQIVPLTNSEKENCADQLKVSLESTVKDLTELKLFTLEFMKRDMKKEYLVDMGSFDEQVNYPLTDQIKVEVTALKEMLLRLEFYLHARSDIEKNLTDFLESKLVEMSVLEDKLAETESAIKNKEAEFYKIECALLGMEENVSKLVQKLKSLESVEDKINHFEFDNDTSFILHSNKSLKCITSIQRFVSEIDALISKKIIAVNDLSLKLETQNNLNFLQSRQKETKSVQTVNGYDYSELSQKLKEAEASVEKLDGEIKNLKFKLEILTKENDNLQEELNGKANFYDMKIEDMKIKFDAEKEEWASKCVKITEEKYYQMIMDQESKFLEEKHQSELDFYKQISDYEKKLADQFDQLQEENRNNVTDLKSKLNAEIEERYSERIKLEDKIRAREKDIIQYREYNSYLKSKCKELAVELKKHKEKAKSFEQRENVLQEKINEKSVENKKTQTDDNQLEDNTKSSPDLCDQCKSFMQKITDLEAVHQSTVKKSQVLLTKLQNDLEAKKAKIISLDTNNAKMVQEIVALKKEISTKSMMLRFCQCRGLAYKVSEAPNSGKLESAEKDKAINLNTENNKEKPTDLRDNLDDQNILQKEVVQDAIKKAREEVKELLLTGGGSNGPANSMQCYYLRAKLNKKILELDKKNEELNSLKTEMAKLKKQLLKQGFELINEPSKNIKGVERNFFTPYTNPDDPVGEALHPKMRRRNVLKETNRKHIAPFPTSKEELRKERMNNENFDPFNIPISLEVLNTRKSTEKQQEDKDKAVETQRQIEMLFGAPQLPWEYFA